MTVGLGDTPWDTVWQTAPDLWNTPSLVPVAATSGDPAMAGVALAHLNNVAGMQEAVQPTPPDQQADAPWWQKALHTVTNAPVIHQTLDAMAAPLHEVQHEYRYLHDVWVNHGVLAFMGQALQTATGAVVGGLLGGPWGARIGAELTTELGRFEYSDSWARSEHSNVSFGRDVAHLLGADDTDSGFGKILSGTLDAGFDFSLDPLIGAGKLSAARQTATGFGVKTTEEADQLTRAGQTATAGFARTGKVFGEDIQQAAQGIRNKFADWIGAPGIGLSSVEQIEKAYKLSPAVQRAAKDIANLDDAAQIVKRYGDGLGPVATDLASAKSAGAVIDVFKNSLGMDQMARQVKLGTLPTRSLFRAKTNLDRLVEKGAGDYNRSQELPLLFGLKRTAQLGTADRPSGIAPGMFEGGEAPELAEGATKFNPALEGTGSQVVEGTRVSTQLGFLPRLLVTAPAAIFGKTELIKSDFQRMFSRKVRTFTNKLPFEVDPNTGKLSATQIDLSNNDNLSQFYQVAKFGLGEKMARSWTDQFARALNADGTPNLALRHAMFAELLPEVLKASGLVDDADAVAQLTKFGRYVSGRALHTTAYGSGLKRGDDVNQVRGEDASARYALRWDQRASHVSLPNFRQLKLMNTKMKAYTAWYGKLDDFAARAYTDSFFKPLALLTMGFGIRVGLSEALPAAMRYGAVNMLRGRVSATAQKLGYKLTEATARDQFVARAMANKEVQRAFQDARLSSRLDAENGIEDVQIAGLSPADEATARHLWNNTYEDHLKDESHHVLAAAAKAAGGIDKLVSNDRIRDAALRTILTNQGHIAHGIVEAGHGSDYILPENSSERARQILGYEATRRMGFLHPTGDFRQVPWDDEAGGYIDSWSAQLSRWARDAHGMNIAADIRRSIAEGKSLDEAMHEAVVREASRIRGVNPETGLEWNGKEDPYLRERNVLARYVRQSPEAHAADLVDSLMGATVGRDGTVHDWMLKHIERGQNHRFTADRLRSIGAGSRPLQQPGHVLDTHMHVGNVMGAIVDRGFKRLIDPMINYLSREPLYINEVANQWDILKGMVARGDMKEETAFRLAQQRAVRAILPQIHNTALRTQFHVMVRNFMPFYFAQEQALKRAGHLIARSPQAFREYQLIEHGLTDPHFITKDAYGNSYMTVPLIGHVGASFLGAMSRVPVLKNFVVGGLPLTVQGDMASLGSVLPETRMPSASPFAAIATTYLASASGPDADQFAAMALGKGYNENWMAAIIPNTAIRNAIIAATADEGNSSYMNALLTSMEASFYHGTMPSAIEAEQNPGEVQRWLQRMKNNARSIMMIKAMAGAISPLAPSVSEADAGFVEEWSRLREKYPIEQAMQVFLHEHGERAISYTVAHTKSIASVPYTKPVYDYIHQNEALSEQHPYAVAYLAPQAPAGEGHDESGIPVYNELLKTGLATRRTPEEFFTAIHVAMGNRIYFAAEKNYMAQKAAAMGLSENATPDEIAAAPSNPQADALTTQFNNWKNTNFRLAEPLAYAALVDPDKVNQAQAAYNDIVESINSGNAPVGSPMTAKVAQLITMYQDAQARLAELGGDPSVSSQRTAIRDQYALALKAAVAADPDLEAIYQGIFSRLAV